MNQQEIMAVEKIRASYQEKEISKTEELKALDKRVKRPAKITAYVHGSVGALVMGTGMCLSMSIIGASVPLGIGVGILGIAMCSVNYLFYKRLLKKRKDKFVSQIMELSGNILNEKEI